MSSHSSHDPAPGLAGRDVLYQHLARIGHAASNPHRLRLLGLLGQGEKTVERQSGCALIRARVHGVSGFSYSRYVLSGIAPIRLNVSAHSR